uniref:Uncharacterized protein n=1 Tax=Arion vulgaris TaxID=1028688 RepID=A0A0B7A7F9_9EUPU
MLMTSQKSTLKKKFLIMTVKKQLVRAIKISLKHPIKKQMTLQDTSKATKVNIKNDPDASTSLADDESHAADGAVNETDTDFKGTFLEPSTSEDNQDTTEQNANQEDTNDNNELSSVGTSELSISRECQLRIS